MAADFYLIPDKNGQDFIKRERSGRDTMWNGTLGEDARTRERERKKVYVSHYDLQDLFIQHCVTTTMFPQLHPSFQY